MGRKKLTQEEKDEQAHKRYCEKIKQEVYMEQHQPHVKKLTITVEWRKSKAWISNPHATGEVLYMDGSTSNHLIATCSGCGYDKESTVVADIFNGCLKYKLWDKDIKHRDKPYGVSFIPPYNGVPETRRFEGGVGTGCYYRIAPYIGGEFTHIVSRDYFDVYQYIDNEEMPKLNNEEE